MYLYLNTPLHFCQFLLILFHCKVADLLFLFCSGTCLRTSLGLMRCDLLLCTSCATICWLRLAKHNHLAHNHQPPPPPALMSTSPPPRVCCSGPLTCPSIAPSGTASSSCTLLSVTGCLAPYTIVVKILLTLL